MDDFACANTECCVPLRPLGTKPLGPESHWLHYNGPEGISIAMIAGMPYTALRDAVLTHPTLVEGLQPLFSSAASAHKVVETRRARTSGA
jgi:hypothetical protein